MGDIWLPGYPPAYTSWLHCLALLAPYMPTRADAVILAAIAGPESGFDWTVINDTPSTGDYSVGLWQINYLGSLYAERSRLYGTPLEMVAGGPAKQAFAAQDVWHSQGWQAWSTTYNSGAWRNFIGAAGVPGPYSSGQVPPAPPAPADDWSAVVRRAAGRTRKTAVALRAGADAIARL